MKRYLCLALLTILAIALGLALPAALMAQTVTSITVGTTPFPTIASAVNTACAAGATGPWQIIIPIGATPTDTVDAITKGCQRVYITDQRQTPPVTCQWVRPGFICNTGVGATASSSPTAGAGTVTVQGPAGNAYFANLTNGFAFSSIEHVFAGAGSFTFAHNTGALYPAISCYAKSGTSRFTLSPVDTSSMTVTVPGRSDLVCSFSGATGTLGATSGSGTPTASSCSATPAGGTYTGAQTVTLASSTTGAVCHYTLDGSTPTCSSTAASAPISLAATGTLSMIACESGYTTSSVTTAAYTINGPPSGGLVDYWPMSEGTGSTFHNSITSANTMALSGVSWASTTGFAAAAPVFSGSSSEAVAAQVHAASNFDSTTPWSISVWAKAQTSGSGLNPIFSNGNIESYVVGGVLQINVWGSTSNKADGGATDAIQVHTESGYFPLNTLMHVVWTYDGSKSAAGVKLYLNGSLCGTSGGGSPCIITAPYSDSLTTSTAGSLPWTLGSFATTNAYPYVGNIAGFRIYNRALTSTDVTSIYTAGAE